MKIVNYLTVLVALLIIAFSCTEATIDDDEAPMPDPDPVEETVKYDPEVRNIISANCVDCHGGTAPQAGLDLSTYENVRASAEAGTLLSRIEDISNPMPPSGLMKEENRQIIAKWAADGFEEN